MSIMYLPKNLEHLSKLTATDACRYSMTGIHVEERDGGYRCVATDGKYLAIVEGENASGAGMDSVASHLATAPNTARTALIPSEDFAAALRTAPKAKGKNGVAGVVGCVLSEAVSTLCSVNGANTSTMQPANVKEDGKKFPNYDAIVPKEEPCATVAVDPVRLAELLQVAAKIGVDHKDGACRVVLELRGKGTPVIVRTQTTEQNFVGLVMPLDDPGDSRQAVQRKLDSIRELANAASRDGTTITTAELLALLE